MSTKMTARGIVGSLRLVGVTAAVAAFATIGATPASAAPSAENGNVPVKACANMERAGVPLEVLQKHCIVIPDEGEIIGGSIFG